MNCLVALIEADLKIEQLRLQYAIENNPMDIDRRQKRISSKIGEYEELLDNLPSLKKVEKSIKSCVAKMGWWQKHIAQRDIVAKAKDLEGLHLSEVKVPSALGAETVQGYVFWQEKDTIEVIVLPEVKQTINLAT